MNEIDACFSCGMWYILSSLSNSMEITVLTHHTCARTAPPLCHQCTSALRILFRFLSHEALSVLMFAIGSACNMFASQRDVDADPPTVRHPDCRPEVGERCLFIRCKRAFVSVELHPLPGALSDRRIACTNKSRTTHPKVQKAQQNSQRTNLHNLRYTGSQSLYHPQGFLPFSRPLKLGGK